MNANNIKKPSAFIKYKIKWNISRTCLQKMERLIYKPNKIKKLKSPNSRSDR